MALKFCKPKLPVRRPAAPRPVRGGCEGRFKGVELLAPYEVPAKAIRERLDGAGLRQILFNSPSGDRAAGERGIACLPGREGEFWESVHRALDYVALDCKLVHLMAGVQPKDVPHDRATALYALHRAWAAKQAHAAVETELLSFTSTRNLSPDRIGQYVEPLRLDTATMWRHFGIVRRAAGEPCWTAKLQAT